MEPLEEEDTVKEKKKLSSDVGIHIIYGLLLILVFIMGVQLGIDDQRFKIEGIIEAYRRVDDVRHMVEAERDACLENWNQFIQKQHGPYEETL